MRKTVSKLQVLHHIDADGNTGTAGNLEVDKSCVFMWKKEEGRRKTKKIHPRSEYSPFNNL